MITNQSMNSRGYISLFLIPRLPISTMFPRKQTNAIAAFNNGVNDKNQQQQPQKTPYTAEQMVAVNSYNLDILSDLENYVNEQIEPDRMSAQIAARILVKALMAMPAPDFISLCLLLIPERAINVEGLSLDRFIEHQVVKCGWIVEKGCRHYV